MGKRDIQNATLQAPARKVASFGLCQHCLGRCFARVDYGLGNDERGRLLCQEWDLDTVPPGQCHVCEGLMGRIEPMTSVVEAALARVEFEHFLVGTRVHHAIEEREETLWDAIEAEDTEGIGSELNREIGKRLAETHNGPGHYDWDVEFQRPDVAAILDTTFDHVDLDRRPVFLYGRYKKLARGIPQTKWPCRRCKGTGCTDCHGSGKQYLLSVEEKIAAPAQIAADAPDAKFHGAGREDVDAKMLGTGRPFVLELSDPNRRFLNLDILQRVINTIGKGAVQVGPLKQVPKDAVQQVKEARGDKTYRATVTFDAPVPRETLKNACHMLEGAEVAQRTPSRVAHRRADKTRHRTVARCRLETLDDDELHAQLLIEGDAGLYIKELVSGDNDRTKPSLAAAVDTPAECTALDVVHVEGPEALDDERMHPPTE